MKKIVGFLCAAVLTLSAVCGFTACSKEDPSKTLYIELENAGFGIEWVDGIIDIFEAEHPGITVKKTDIIKGGGTIVSKVLSGATTLDIVFVEHEGVFASYDTPVTNNGVRYASPFADLTDIYEANVPGETVKLKDKMEASYRDYTNLHIDGKDTWYSMPWMQAPLGIVINNKVFARLKQTTNGARFQKMPNTTDEFLSYCAALVDPANATGVTPCIDPMLTSVFDGGLYEGWVVQYNGRAAQAEWYQGKTLSGEKAGEMYRPEMFEDDGLYYALEVLQNLWLPSNGYMHADKALDFTSVQNGFLEGNKNILFMPAGGWLAREMEVNYTRDEVDVEFIKLPIISALGTKLGITDAQLSAIVDYVDGTTAEKPAFTSTAGKTEEEVIAAVTEARGIVPSQHQFNAMIPSYSTKVDLAKEFLQLMATDRALESMIRKCGSCAPFAFDVTNKPELKEEIGNFNYSVNQMAAKGYAFFKKSALFTRNGLKLLNGLTGEPASFFGNDDASYRKTARGLVTESTQYVNGQWSSYLKKAGIIK